MNSRPAGTVLPAIISCMLWASAFSVIKIGLKYSPPMQFAGIRFIIAGAILLPFCLKNRTFIKTVTANFKIILKIAFFQTFIQYTLFYMGMERVPGALGAIIHGSGPLFAALLAHFLMQNDRLTIKKLIIISLGITGVTLVGLGRGSMCIDSAKVYLGIALLILSNVNSGYSNIIIAREAIKIPPLATSSVSMITGGIILLGVSIFTEGLHFKNPPATYYFSLLWLSFLSAAALTIWFALLQKPGLKVSSLNMWKFIIPVFGAILSWILLPEEKPDLLTVAGMTVTAAALIILYFDAGSRQNCVKTAVSINKFE